MCYVVLESEMFPTNFTFNFFNGDCFGLIFLFPIHSQISVKKSNFLTSPFVYPICLDSLLGYV